MVLIGSNWDYWKQILIDVGGTPLNDDTEWNLAWKTLALGHANGVNDDTLRDLVAKIVGATMKPGDNLNDAYRRFYKSRFGTDAPSIDSDNDLLRAIANKTITPGTFALSAPSGGAWTLTETGSEEGIATLTISAIAAGATGWRARYTDDTTPASTGEDSVTIRDLTKDYTFTAGDVIHVQIAWFYRGVQMSDWSTAKDLTLSGGLIPPPDPGDWTLTSDVPTELEATTVSAPGGVAFFAGRWSQDAGLTWNSFGDPYTDAPGTLVFLGGIDTGTDVSSQIRWTDGSGTPISDWSALKNVTIS